MDNDGAKALIRWVRAVTAKGVGIASGPRLLLLRESLCPSMRCVSGSEPTALHYYADLPEIEWLEAFDRMLVADDEIGFEALEGRLLFVMPRRQAKAAFCGAQHCLLCTQEGHLRARLEIQGIAGGLDPSPLGMGLPRLVFR